MCKHNDDYDNTTSSNYHHNTGACYNDDYTIAYDNHRDDAGPSNDYYDDYCSASKNIIQCDHSDQSAWFWSSTVTTY